MGTIPKVALTETVCVEVERLTSVKDPKIAGSTLPLNMSSGNDAKPGISVPSKLAFSAPAGSISAERSVQTASAHTCAENPPKIGPAGVAEAGVIPVKMKMIEKPSRTARNRMVLANVSICPSLPTMGTCAFERVAKSSRLIRKHRPRQAANRMRNQYGSVLHPDYITARL